MPNGKQRSLQQIETFIKKRMPEKLRRDLKRLRIVKEADLECATYHHLRRFIGEDPRWRILARKHVPLTGFYVDLIIFKKYEPAIAIELKWGRPCSPRWHRSTQEGTAHRRHPSGHRARRDCRACGFPTLQAARRDPGAVVPVGKTCGGYAGPH